MAKDTSKVRITSMNDEDDEKKSDFVSTRHRDAIPDLFDPKKPRLGRRESEPHSSEITYLHDVLSTNFPDDRTMWDLHHYFSLGDIDLDLQFDISYFRGLKIPYMISSYHAKRFQNRVPTLAINVLSKSTWKTDIGENVDSCRLLKIPIYVVFPSYHVATKIYQPPFLRAYILQDDGSYSIKELKDITINEETGEINEKAIINVTDIVPFRFGLLKQKVKYNKDKPLYRVILLHPTKFEVLLTKREQAQQEAEKAKTEAKRAKTEAEKAKTEAEKAKTEAKRAKTEAEKAKTEAKKAKNRVSELKEENKRLKELVKKSS
ncbi:MAG: hypothetical protein ACTSW1_17295 [Candidatus Hodarchaeales archaeon]